MTKFDAPPPKQPGQVQLQVPKLLEDLPKQHSDIAIVTVAPDAQTQSELAITGHRFARYAATHGADYIPLTKMIYGGHPCANKYAVRHVIPRYRQTLLIDCDVVVQRFDESIFGAVPNDHWGMVDDLPKIKATGDQWMQREWDAMADAIGLPRIPMTNAWNSGVVVIPQTGLESYQPPSASLPDIWCVEQHHHTRLILDNCDPIVTLPDVWNMGWPWLDFADRAGGANFVHLNGCPHPLRLEFLSHIDQESTDFDCLRDDAAKVPHCHWAKPDRLR